MSRGAPGYELEVCIEEDCGSGGDQELVGCKNSWGIIGLPVSIRLHSSSFCCCCLVAKGGQLRSESK